MPGAEMGRTPSARSSEWMPAEEITRGPPAPESSAVTISDKARPAQSREALPLRFSMRRMARRSAGGAAGWRRQLGMGRASRRAGAAYPQPTRSDRPGGLSHWLKNTRLQGEKLLEFERLAQPGKGRVVGQLLAVLVALFESLSQVLEGEFVAPVLSVNGSHHVVEFGAILHAALLQQRTVAGVVLEDLGIELERDAVFLVGERQQVARVVGGSEVAVDGCRIGRELDGLLILRDGPAVAFGSVVHRTQIVDRFGVGWLQLDGLLVVFPGYIELHELMVRDADFIAQHGIFRRTLAEGFDGLTIHLASHENIAAALGGENRFGRF